MTSERGPIRRIGAGAEVRDRVRDNVFREMIDHVAAGTVHAFGIDVDLPVESGNTTTGV